MARETERKFLVVNDAWRAEAEGAADLVQFYLFAGPDRSLRVRIRDGRSAVVTLKFGDDARVRDEFEYPVPLADARSMRPFAIGRVLEKRRHLAAWRGHLYEIDVFGGPLAGLVLAELESEAVVSDADLPPWLGREVSDDPRYLNAALALSDGGPPR